MSSIAETSEKNNADLKISTDAKTIKLSLYDLWDRHTDVLQTQSSKSAEYKEIDASEIQLIDLMIDEIRTRLALSQITSNPCHIADVVWCNCPKNQKSVDYAELPSFHPCSYYPDIKHLPHIDDRCIRCYETCELDGKLYSDYQEQLYNRLIKVKTHSNSSQKHVDFPVLYAKRIECTHCMPGYTYAQKQATTYVSFTYEDQPISEKLRNTIKPNRKTWNWMLSAAIMKLKHSECRDNIKRRDNSYHGRNYITHFINDATDIKQLSHHNLKKCWRNVSGNKFDIGTLDISMESYLKSIYDSFDGPKNMAIIQQLMPGILAINKIIREDIRNSSTPVVNSTSTEPKESDMKAYDSLYIPFNAPTYKNSAYSLKIKMHDKIEQLRNCQELFVRGIIKPESMKKINVIYEETCEKVYAEANKGERIHVIAFKTIQFEAV